MIVGRVIGQIHSTIHHPFYDARRLLIVERGLPGTPATGYLIAVDVVDAGVGETVLVLDEGNGARQVLGDPHAPVRSVVVGIVDDMADETAETGGQG
jgi:ethanolamine utilization protein EutN